MRRRKVSATTWSMERTGTKTRTDVGAAAAQSETRSSKDCGKQATFIFPESQVLPPEELVGLYAARREDITDALGSGDVDRFYA